MIRSYYEVVICQQYCHVLQLQNTICWVFGGEKEGGGVMSGPGAARTILLFYVISVFFVSARTNKRHHHLGPLNSLLWYVPSQRYTRGLGWRMHCGVEVTESSTNKQHISKKLKHTFPPPTCAVHSFAFNPCACYLSDSCHSFIR
jgi:hypothetical protein